MSNTPSQRPISPEAVAAKLAAARNFEYPEVLQEIEREPRLVEALLFLQFVSQPGNYAGGLKKFAFELIEESQDLMGTHLMLDAPAGPLSPETVREIFNFLPYFVRQELGCEDEALEMAVLLCSPDLDKCDLAAIDKQLAGLTLQRLNSLCRSAASEGLATYLRQLCELPHVQFTRTDDVAGWVSHCAPWYFPRIGEALLRFMDRRKERLANTIAETSVTRLIFDWLGRARRMSRSVMISGNSRFGKTEALRTFCAMNPGLARLVKTPDSNTLSDLIREVAKAIGLEVGATINSSQLRDRIDYVLQHTRFMLVFDEAHLLFPIKFTKNTAPARLNWVRRSVMDAGLPCAFCFTPQSFKTARKRYLKTTDYAIEQFEERPFPPVELPDELSQAELLAVARIHFPKLKEAYLEYVVEKALATERNYVSDVEKIAALAYDAARESGRPLPMLDDIKAAISIVLPTPSAAKPASPVSSASKPPARALQPASHRESAPAALPPSRITFESEQPEEQLIGGD